MKKSHNLYYLSLLSVLFFGIVLIIVFSEDSLLQMLTVVGVAFSYVILGLVHHLIDHDLVAKIVVEYILIAALGIAAAFFVFRGGFGF
ncbi:MAG: hypothetical protein ACD_37C00313G0004 [uncultured bacterium]|nr:MAG: hypothetical protein ACD_37C00313G0004 [uncultured bacterium]